MESKEKNKEAEVDKIVVVNELPTQPANMAQTEQGENIKLITIADALTEIREDVKDIKKSIA